MTDNERIVAKAAEQARETGARRVILAFAAAGGAFAIVLFVLVLVLRGQVDDVSVQQSTAAGAAQELAHQVRQLGATPVVSPPTPIVGPTGAQGPAGQNGVAGSEGQPGPSGPPGANGSPGSTGNPGAPGGAGTPGQQGTDGQDGAQGPAGPAGPAGPQGDQGPPGADGADGAPPAAWTWQDPTSGMTFTCTRDSGSPDSAPTYTCNSDSTDPTSPPQLSDLLGVNKH
jgi:hypothetical protein